MRCAQARQPCSGLLQVKYAVGIFLIVTTWLHANPSQLQSSLTVDSLETYGVVLKDVSVSLDIGVKDTANYRVHIKSASWPGKNIQIENITLMCPQGNLSTQEISCSKGELSFEGPFAKAKAAAISFYRKKNNDMSLRLHAVQFVEGQASLEIEMQQGKWQANVMSDNLPLAKLQTIFVNFPELSLVGKITGNLNLVGNLSAIQSIQGDAIITDLSFTNAASTMVAEGVTAKIIFDSEHANRIWVSDFSTTVSAGEFYFDPLFINAKNTSKDVFGTLKWAMDTSQIELAPLQFEDQHAVHIIINTLIDYEQKKLLSPVQLNVEYSILPKAYEIYIQPFLLDTNLADLDTHGSLAGSIVIDDSEIIEANLKLNNLSVEDKQKRFTLTKLDGEIAWGSRYADSEYVIQFDAAHIYKLRLGQSQFSFFNQGETLVLNQAASVPILDGAVNIESFLVHDPGKKDQSISLDISLTPVSMKKVSSVFQWPEMSGNLAGYAPNVTYQQGSLDVQGALLIRAFEGTTTIHNLKAGDLFGITPKFFADIQIDNLDLSTVTGTFSFGEISGKLNGYINNLQLVNWQPIQFDAWLGTPDGDTSRHRISQTAVDNLTQVGNGVSNIFSKSFLRIFDSFGYDRLGIGCRLKNTTCKMRGVTSDDKGFYIVKGSGIPRIDIIGFTNEVSWPVLTARLKRVISTQELVVQ